MFTVLMALVFNIVSATVRASNTSHALPVSVAQSDLSDKVGRAWISAIGNDRAHVLSQMQNQYDGAALLRLTASNGKSALMVASKVGDLPLAKTLVAAGASVHDTTVTNGTAFMFAILGSQQDLVDWLFEMGADVNVVGSNGWTALTIAAAKGNRDLLQWLLDRGADAQVRDIYRYTPLLRAVDNGYITTAELLLTLPGTDINARDEYDNTALHHAMSAKNLAMIRLLLKHGADASLRNRDGISATALASGISDLEYLLRQTESD